MDYSDEFTQEMPDYDVFEPGPEIPLYVNSGETKKPSGKGSVAARNRAQVRWYHRHRSHRRDYMRRYMRERRARERSVAMGAGDED